ncbi:MAG: hypothetical protein LBG27_12055 [Spirochaetaceae bacterium]|jgi:hypothetical protein|nr:hypothetical protein [Spirochaetaceae bacterium]
MNTPRKLKQNAWYNVGTEVNIGEPLFQFPWAKTLFSRALRDANGIFDFEMRGLKLEGAWLTFCIKPDDGLKLPLIMQWLKQTFSVRLNVLTGRLGHVWGERYWSEILWGGPHEGAEAVDWAAVETLAETPIEGILTYKLSWGSPRSDGMTITTSFSAKNASKPASPPG